MSRTHPTPQGDRIDIEDLDKLAMQIERSIRQRLQADPIVADSVEVRARVREQQLCDGFAEERGDFIQISVDRLNAADLSRNPMQRADAACRAAVDAVGLEVSCPPILDGVAISHFNLEVEVPDDA